MRGELALRHAVGNSRCGTRALTPDDAHLNARTIGALDTGKPLKDTPYVKDVLRAISTISIPKHLIQKHVDQASGVVKDIVSRKQASGIFCDLVFGILCSLVSLVCLCSRSHLPPSVGSLTQIHTWYV